MASSFLCFRFRRYRFKLGPNETQCHIAELCLTLRCTVTTWSSHFPFSLPFLRVSVQDWYTPSNVYTQTRSADLFLISHKALGWGSLAPDSYSNPQADSQQVRDRNRERQWKSSWLTAALTWDGCALMRCWFWRNVRLRLHLLHTPQTFQHCLQELHQKFMFKILKKNLKSKKLIYFFDFNYFLCRFSLSENRTICYSVIN